MQSGSHLICFGPQMWGGTAYLFTSPPKWRLLLSLRVNMPIVNQEQLLIVFNLFLSRYSWQLLSFCLVGQHLAHKQLIVQPESWHLVALGVNRETFCTRGEKKKKSVNIRNDYIKSKCSLLYSKVQIAIIISNIYVLDEVIFKTHIKYVQTSGHEVKGQLARYLKFFCELSPELVW